MRAFIIDDDKTVSDVTSGLLKSDGFECEVADFESDLIAQVRAGQFGVVLMDIMMPDVDDIELCRQIKDDPALK